MASHELEEEDQGQQPNGTKHSPSLDLVARRRRKKLREAISFDSISLRPRPRPRHRREVSTDLFGLSKQLQQLSIDDKAKRIHERGQVIFQRQTQPGLKLFSAAEAHLMAHGKSKEQSRDASVFEDSTTPAATPPPRSKDIEARMGMVETALKSLRQHPSSPLKSCSPSKPVFLTKDSNLTSYTGFDVNGRLDEVESQFKLMQEAMNVSLTDRKTLEDAVDLAKTRGRFPCVYNPILVPCTRDLGKLELPPGSLERPIRIPGKASLLWIHLGLDHGIRGLFCPD